MKPTRSRKWFFIFVLTVIIPVSFFLLLELGLKLSGYGYPTASFIPRGLEGRKVFSDNPKFSLRFFPSKLARPFCHLIIPAEKASGTFRIFVLGESAAMGDPDFSFGFSRMLEKMLQHRYPDVRFEVFNAAVTAINSNVVLPIARDCAKLKPDLFVIYLGNNEVIGPYGPGTVFAPFLSSLGFIRTSIFLNTTKTVQLVNGLIQQWRTNEDDAQIWTGVDMFIENRLRFDDPRMAVVYNHFRENLIDICRVGQQAGARVILSTVSTNIKNCAPFGSLHRLDLTETGKIEWDRDYQAGIVLESSGEFKAAIDAYQKAIAIDDEFADLHFRLARCFYALAHYNEAHTHFIKARNFDALRFRADTQINEIIRNIAKDGTTNGISFIDAEKTFESESALVSRSDGQTSGIPGENLFYDHVHMNPTGNYLLARMVQETVEMLLGLESQNAVLSETECMENLALTPWDRYRMEKEILGRMKSPAFANQLDNQEDIQRWEAKLDSIKTSLLAPEALERAKENYRHAIKKQEQDWVLWNNFGLLLLEAGNDPVGAAEQFRHILRLFPEDYLTYNNLGLAWMQQNKLDGAIACYQEALRIKPDFSKANFNLGETLERQGKYEEAFDYYRKANLSEDGLADAHNRFGIRLANEGRIDEAIAQFNQALSLFPDSPDAHGNLGKLFAQLGKAEVAIHHFSEVVRIKPDLAQGHIDLASLFFSQRNYKNAVVHYTKALQIRPELPEVQNNLGLALCNLGEYQQAIPHFKEALARKPDYLAARNNLAGALSQLGRNAEAIAELEMSLKISPDNPNAHNNIGAELLRIGKIEPAIVHFKKALQLNPNLSSAQNNLKYALSRLQNNDE